MSHRIISMDLVTRAFPRILAKHQMQGHNMALYFPMPGMKRQLCKVPFQERREMWRVRSLTT